MREPYFFAIDLGTSGAKVALVTLVGEIIGSELEETPVLFVDHGGVEQDPHHWWQAVSRASKRLLSRSLVPPEQIAGICATTQWSGTVPVDAAGQPLANAIIWMDARGAPYVNGITGGPLKIEGYGIDKLWTWLRLTGGIPTRSGKDSIAHILYLKHRQPDIYAATHKFLEPKDYLNLCLTGRFAASPCSIALHWLTDNRNIDKVDYHPRLLALSGVEREKLPDIQPAAELLGPLQEAAAAELGLLPGTPVVTGTPDIPSAAVGSGAIADYAAHLYLGTSSWLTCHVPFKKTDLFHNMASLPAAIPGRYFIANEQEIAGGALTFLRDQVLYPADELQNGPLPDDFFARLDQMARAARPSSSSPFFLPWLNGERTPVEDHHVRGGFVNLSLQTDRRELVRAVYEGVALNSRWLLTYVERFIARPLPAVNIIGGGARSAAWCQIHADVLGRPVHQIAEPLHANARGAAWLAAVALGYTTFDALASQAPVSRTFTPDRSRAALYDARFAAFQAFYKAQRKIYAGLNGR